MKLPSVLSYSALTNWNNMPSAWPLGRAQPEARPDPADQRGVDPAVDADDDRPCAIGRARRPPQLSLRPRRVHRPPSRGRDRCRARRASCGRPENRRRRAGAGVGAVRQGALRPHRVERRPPTARPLRRSVPLAAQGATARPLRPRRASLMGKA